MLALVETAESLRSTQCLTSRQRLYLQFSLTHLSCKSAMLLWPSCKKYYRIARSSTNRPAAVNLLRDRSAQRRPSRVLLSVLETVNLLSFTKGGFRCKVSRKNSKILLSTQFQAGSHGRRSPQAKAASTHGYRLYRRIAVTRASYPNNGLTTCAPSIAHRGPGTSH